MPVLFYGRLSAKFFKHKNRRLVTGAGAAQID